MNNITEEERYQGLVLEGWKLYLLIATCVITFSIISYNAYTAHSQVQKVTTSLEQSKTSTGAKIEYLLNKRTENKKQWAEEQKKIDSAVINQSKLNSNTEKLEEELEKYNISVIQ